MSFERFGKKIGLDRVFRTKEYYLTQIGQLMNQFNNMNARLEGIHTTTDEHSLQYQKIFDSINKDRLELLQKKQALEKNNMQDRKKEDEFITNKKLSLALIETSINKLSSEVYHQIYGNH